MRQDRQFIENMTPFTLSMAIAMILAFSSSLRAQDADSFDAGATINVGADLKGRATLWGRVDVQEFETPPFPPELPRSLAVVADTSDLFLTPPDAMRGRVDVAETPPTVDFLYYPGQTYPGKPWSNWGDSLAVGDKYYASIGDHLAPKGNAFVFEYDSSTKTLRRLLDIQSVLRLPEGRYVPGKIHGRLDVGRDDCLYFSTHRGSSKATTDENGYIGDWILRHDLASGQSEIVTHAPISKHCIPASVLDPERLIFYGGTAAGQDAGEQEICFFAWDVEQDRMLFSQPGGPARYILSSSSTGKVYFVPGNAEGPLLCYDPKTPEGPFPMGVTVGIRAATQETSDGVIYFVSSGQGENEPILYSLDVKTHEVKMLGNAAVGSQRYIATLDVDPTGRYLYYIPGAHGGSNKDGTAVVQYDVATKRKKVIAFLNAFYENAYGASLRGTYSAAMSPEGDKLYITWNVSRGSRAWDCCALTVIHIPESERSGD